MPNGGPETITLEMPTRSAPADDAIPQPVRRPRGVEFRAMAVARENFDRWLFADELSQVDRRRRLEDILDAKIVLADLEHRLMLTAQRRAKLRLAGRGDIKRFFDKVEDRRGKFEKERQEFPAWTDCSARPRAARAALRGRPVQRRLALRQDAPGDQEGCEDWPIVAPAGGLMEPRTCDCPG